MFYYRTAGCVCVGLTASPAFGERDATAVRCVPDACATLSATQAMAKYQKLYFAHSKTTKANRNRTDDRVFTLGAVIDRPLLVVHGTALSGCRAQNKGAGG